MARRGWALWGLLSTVGAVLVALPDDGDRLVSFSRTHGPAALDAVGAGVLVLAWSLLWVGVWRRRDRLPRRGTWWAGAGAVLACGGVVLVWSVLGDHGAWWVLGAGAVAGVQLLAALLVSDRRPEATSEPARG